jgi:ABC-type antimicrobial peptide transport system permease subunit
MHFVNSRRKELAVRVCFGASRHTIQKTIVMQALLSGTVGALIALMSGRILIQIISVKWLGAASWSWSMGWMVTMACVVATLLISLIPASAAAKVSPADVLKEQ